MVLSASALADVLSALTGIAELPQVE